MYICTHKEVSEKYLTNNIMGTHNLIEACKKAKIEKIVYASTSCVMAGNSLPWNENEKLGYQTCNYLFIYS